MSGEHLDIIGMATGWMYSLSDQAANYDGRLMFLSGLVSSFVLSQMVAWITSSALRLAIIAGVVLSAGTGILTVLPKPSGGAAALEQVKPPPPSPPPPTQAPIRLTPQTQQPTQTQAQPVRRN